MRFQEIIGHDDIILNLQTMLENNQINHALLFDGIGGIGKKYTAKVFANSLLCEGKEAPCGECPKCLQFQSSSNPDYLFLTSENNVIKKNQISELIDFLSIKPFDSKYKVALVEHFDNATIEAQNALLKTLEEGPTYAKIILLSENSRNILSTVMSRVKTYKFYPISKFKLIEYLVRNFNIDEEEASFYADFSNGSIGKAIKIINDEEFRVRRKEIIDIFDKALKGQKSYVVSQLDIFKNIEDLENILEIYLTWLRDLMILKSTGKKKYLYNRDLERVLISETHLSNETISKIQREIIKLKENLKYNVSEELALELFFINILEECQWQR